MDEFLIGQFVPSRSDEQFHDGVVSPLIRLKRIWFCVHKPCRVSRLFSSSFNSGELTAQCIESEKCNGRMLGKINETDRI